MMKFSLALAAALFLPVLVNAQSTTSSAAPPSNSVTVQISGFTYSPPNITASNGTIVTFILNSVEHSVTQGSFANPCVYLAAAGGNPAGFDSGVVTNKQFTLEITNDQEPVYYFCKEDVHCGLGMVGTINAPTTGNTFDEYLAAAKALGSNEIPLSDSGPVTGGVGAVATETPVATTAREASTSSSGSTESSSTSTPTSSSSAAGHFAANGLFALLAAALGVTLA